MYQLISSTHGNSPLSKQNKHFLVSSHTFFFSTTTNVDAFFSKKRFGRVVNLMATFPKDVWKLILHDAAPLTLIRCSYTCKTLYDVCKWLWLAREKVHKNRLHLWEYRVLLYYYKDYFRSRHYQPGITSFFLKLGVIGRACYSVNSTNVHRIDLQRNGCALDLGCGLGSRWAQFYIDTDGIRHDCPITLKALDCFFRDVLETSYRPNAYLLFFPSSEQQIK